MIAVLAAALALLVPAKPPTPPPRVKGVEVQPPPAWFELAGRARWLAYGSYCWTSERGAAACADFLPPEDRSDLPTARAARGALLTFHLGFRPTRIDLRLVRASGSRVSSVAPAAVFRWRVAGPGTFVITTRSSGGSASYLVRITR